MLFKKIPLIALISIFFLFPLHAEEDVDLNIEDDDPFVWVENFFRPISEEVGESNAGIVYRCGPKVTEIEDPDGPDWSTPEKKASSCSDECKKQCMKKAEKTKEKKETDDVRELLDSEVEYF